MTITTTCIGARPGPDDIAIGNFTESGARPAVTMRACSRARNDDARVPEPLQARTTRAAIDGRPLPFYGRAGSDRQREQRHARRPV